MEYSDANYWFWKINSNAVGMINHRKYIKKHNTQLSRPSIKQNILGLKPKFEVYRYKIRNKIKTQTQFAKQHSIRSFRIRKLTSSENKK
jgi:hypothetical protein